MKGFVLIILLGTIALWHVVLKWFWDRLSVESKQQLRWFVRLFNWFFIIMVSILLGSILIQIVGSTNEWINYLISLGVFMLMLILNRTKSGFLGDVSDFFADETQNK